MKNIIFPRAFAFSIDDLGWNEGSNLSFNIPPGPLRVGIKRKFDINDYNHILKVARSVGVRIQCLFVLSEMDRTNVLAKYPTTTQYREKWDNSLGKLLGLAGIKYANTDFSQIPELNPPAEVNGGGFDHGVHVLNRMNYGNLYYSYSSETGYLDIIIRALNMQGSAGNLEIFF